MAMVEASREFRLLGLNQWLIKQCKEMGILSPTEIQEKTIPEILKGRNCIGCAKTGSGKTAAFALPILQKLSEDPYGIFALVLTPTRYGMDAVSNNCLHNFRTKLTSLVKLSTSCLRCLCNRIGHQHVQVYVHF